MISANVLAVGPRKNLSVCWLRRFENHCIQVFDRYSSVWPVSLQHGHEAHAQWTRDWYSNSAKCGKIYSSLARIFAKSVVCCTNYWLRDLKCDRISQACLQRGLCWVQFFQRPRGRRWFCQNLAVLQFATKTLQHTYGIIATSTTSIDTVVREATTVQPRQTGTRKKVDCRRWLPIVVVKRRSNTVTRSPLRLRLRGQVSFDAIQSLQGRLNLFLAKKTI